MGEPRGRAVRTATTAPVRRTTAWVGVCLVVAAVLQALPLLGAAEPYRPGVPIASPATQLVAALVLAAALLVAALGAPGEPGLAGRSTAGRAALLVAAVVGLLQAAFGLLPAPDVPTVPEVVVAVLLQVVVVVAGVVGAVAIVRAGVLGRVARWALLPWALLRLALSLVSYLPIPPVVLEALVPLLLVLGALEPFLLLAGGLALLLAGRAAAIARRVRAAKDAW